MNTFVYVLNAVETNRFKIGVSRNVPKRVTTIQGQSPFKIGLVSYYDSEDFYGDEHLLHRFFHKYRVLGEWFTFDPVKSAINFFKSEFPNLVPFIKENFTINAIKSLDISVDFGLYPGCISDLITVKDLNIPLLTKPKSLIKAELRWIIDNSDSYKSIIRKSNAVWGDFLNKNDLKRKIALIKEFKRLNIPELMAHLSCVHYSSDTPEVRQLWKNWGRTQENRTGIKRGNSPQILINRIAGKIGYESLAVSTGFSNGRTIKFYILKNSLPCDALEQLPPVQLHSSPGAAVAN